jgi:type II secretory ATPase GspE/PulE/Tfp pilus assembly ATPase PilB-like protein
VDEKANRTFASVLRSILRQDPDVILVGEIRDKETATIAVQAALTGHLVLSTLHANSATQAVPRLLNIGVEAHLLAPSLLGVHAQRLVRRVCPACREPYEPDPMAVEIVLGKRARTPLRLVRGAGCDDCRGTGYAGRLPLHELLVVGEEVRELIYRGGSARDVEKAALRKGFRTLIEDGIRKSLAGLTTLEEVARVASGG